jgi:hypothetical protein
VLKFEKNNKDYNGSWSSSSKVVCNEFLIEINKDCNDIWGLPPPKLFVLKLEYKTIRILMEFGPPPRKRFVTNSKLKSMRIVMELWFPPPTHVVSKF